MKPHEEPSYLTHTYVFVLTLRVSSLRTQKCACWFVDGVKGRRGEGVKGRGVWGLGRDAEEAAVRRRSWRDIDKNTPRSTLFHPPRPVGPPPLGSTPRRHLRRYSYVLATEPPLITDINIIINIFRGNFIPRPSEREKLQTESTEVESPVSLSPPPEQPPQARIGLAGAHQKSQWATNFQHFPNIPHLDVSFFLHFLKKNYFLENDGLLLK